MQLILAATFLLAQTQAAEKLDVGLAEADGYQPVFVRMENQLFKKAGDFEAFCQENESTPRSTLRKTVLNSLQQNADQDWQSIKETVANLVDQEQITDFKRFWIVNGFACEATAEACKTLAARPDVSFVYRQSGPPLRQHRTRNPNRTVQAARDAAMKSAFDTYKSDATTPFSPAGLEIPWNLKQIQADQVWSKENAYGQGTIVAINDGGVYDIPSLRPAIWRNTDEKLDGQDTDGNGYVDDVFGWDPASNSGAVLGNEGVHHGTFCSGIVGGRPTAEKKLVTGVAPRSQLMIINGMGYIAGIEYAVANGADAFSMSYMFTNVEIGNYRGVYRLAAEHATATGMLLCGGAGNFANSAPEGRQITLPKDIPSVVAAAGTQEDGSRPNFSSKGPVTWPNVQFYSDFPADKPLKKPDISAPAAGFPVWSHNDNLRRGWQTSFTGKENDALVTGPRGNSFAGPHVAGVAALMFSANPDLNAWQVQRIINETAKEMGEPGWDALHGHGLLQALPAVQKAKAMRNRQE